MRAPTMRPATRRGGCLATPLPSLPPRHGGSRHGFILDNQNSVREVTTCLAYKKIQVAEAEPMARLRSTAAWPMNCAEKSMTGRSEEQTFELNSLMRSSYAVFCLQKKKTTKAS